MREFIKNKLISLIPYDVAFAEQLEECLFNTTKITDYKDRARLLITSLSPANESLHRDIQRHKYTAEQVAAMDRFSLWPEHWYDAVDAANERALLSIIQQEVTASTSEARCRRCGQNKVTYTLLQTRSADEGMTAFFYCTNCGNRWKQS